MKKFVQKLAVLLVCAMLGTTLLGPAGTVYATSTTDQKKEKPESEMTEAEKAEKEAREAHEKLLKETYELPVQTNELESWPQGPGTYGESAIVMDAETGAILYAKDIDKKQYPASITKILTAMLALDYGNMDAEIVLNDAAVNCTAGGYSHIGLKAGNTITLGQAMYAMMLASANEAAYAVGENTGIIQGHTEDGYAWFIEEMNNRAKELGCENTNFVNTNGVFNEDHYTTARDFALIAKEVFNYPEILEICQTQQYEIPETKNVEQHVFQQHHEMMIEGSKNYFDLVVAGKTGYTTEAENTLVTLADNGEHKLVCVVLKTYEGHSYTDTRALLDYGFENFEHLSIAKEDPNDEYELKEEESSVTVPKGMDFSALERKLEWKEDVPNEAVVSYYYQDMPVGTCEVVVPEIEEANKVEFAESQAVEPEEPKEEGMSLVKIALMVLGGGLVLSLIIATIVTRIIRRRKRQRRRRR